jgi:hypothetical protein
VTLVGLFPRFTRMLPFVSFFKGVVEPWSVVFTSVPCMICQLSRLSGPNCDLLKLIFLVNCTLDLD